MNDIDTILAMLDDDTPPHVVDAIVTTLFK